MDIWIYSREISVMKNFYSNIICKKKVLYDKSRLLYSTSKMEY